MRLALLLIIATLFSVAACTSPRDRLGPATSLAGQWGTVPVPSGGSIGMSLGGVDTLVTGAAYRRHGGPWDVVDSLAATGQLQPDGTFRLTLTLTGGSGGGATYAGRMAGSDRLEGTWTEVFNGTVRSGPLTFTRE